MIGAVLLTIAFGLSEHDAAGKDYYYFAAAANGVQNGCADPLAASAQHGVCAGCLQCTAPTCCEPRT